MHEHEEDDVQVIENVDNMNDMPPLERDPSLDPPAPLLLVPSLGIWMPSAPPPEIITVRHSRCFGYSHNGSLMVRCSLRPSDGSREGKYCSEHQHQYRLDKDDCSVCMSRIDPLREIPLGCGHWTHGACLKAWGQPKCPVCRHQMTTQEVRLYRKELDLTPLRNVVQGYANTFAHMTLLLSDPTRLAGRERETATALFNLSRSASIATSVTLMDDPLLSAYLAHSQMLVNSSAFLTVAQELINRRYPGTH